ncbi:phage tail tape measure protein [Cytobacillus sp. FSL H8-0458]|uniref:phage tail tape measure protein n=1 Tax=Cytobacillus sp. FSL H8-0458 TaxID=2975346 RepID=UPI0030FCD669
MTERIEGLAIGLDIDSLRLDRGLTGLKDRLKTVNSEMKANLSSFDRADRSVAKYETRLQGLNRKLEIQEQIVQASRQEYERMVQEYGEGSREAEAAARSYNNQVAALRNLERSIQRTAQELSDLQNEQEQASSRWANFGESITGVGDKIKDIGQSMTMNVTTPLAGLGVAAGKAALDFDKASGQIQAELGLSEDKVKELDETAKELWENGFGDSIEGVASKVAGVTRSLGDLSKVDLSYVTKGLDLFEQRGWADQQEALRAVKVLMEQFGMSASDAMDYLTKGFQENLNFSGEFLDSISEYSTYFSEFGLTADDMFAKFKAGAESGAFQLDKVGDAMKEFSLRAKDGSKTSTEAFQALGLNATEMTKSFNKGGKDAKKAFETVIKALKDTDSETEKNTAAVGLFGTQFEDLGEKAFDAMLDASKGLENVEGATKKASDALRDNFGTRATKIWRDFATDMAPAGDILLDVAEDVLPKVADTVGDVTEAFAEMSPEGQKSILAIGGLAAAAGPSMFALGTLATGVGALTKVVSPLSASLGLGGGLTGVLSKIPGPVGLVTTGLGLAAAATFGLSDAIKKSKEVNLEHTDSLIKEQLALEDSVTQYEALRNKLTLSNDELGQYLDLQDKIKLATDPSKIQEYKDQMGELQEKSGLTVKEFEKFVGLDKDIRENAPATAQKVSEYGNAFIDLNENLQPILDKQREFINNQLQIEKDKAYDNLKESANQYIETQNTLNETIQRYNDKLLEQAGYRQKAKDLQSEINQAEADGDTARAEHFKREQSMWTEKATSMDSELTRLYEGFSIEQNRLNNLYSRISEEAKVYDQLVEQELKMSNINGKATEAVSLVDSKIAKLQKEQLVLNENYQKGKITTDEYNQQNGKLSEQISKLEGSRGRIVDIQKEQGEVTNEILQQIEKGGNLNTILDKDHLKDIKIDDKGGAAKLQKDVEKNAKKNVNVDDKGGAKDLQKETEKKAKKGVQLTLLNTLSSLLPPFISLPIKFFGGKIGNNAEGTTNWRGGLTWVGEEGPELVHLPQGSKVIPNEDSLSLLKKWSIPTVGWNMPTASPYKMDLGIRQYATPEIQSSEETKENANVAVKMLQYIKNVTIEVVV